MASLLDIWSFVWTVALVVSVYVLVKLARFGSREKYLPPGPPTFPIIGNAHLVVDKDLSKRLVYFPMSEP